MMNREAMRIVNGRMIFGDLSEMQLVAVLEQASSSAATEPFKSEPGANHREWVMTVKDVIQTDGHVYRVEGQVRIIEAASPEEAMPWFVEIDCYWQALDQERERKVSHGSD